MPNLRGASPVGRDDGGRRTRLEQAAKGKSRVGDVGSRRCRHNCGWLSPADLAVEREESGRGAECAIELRTHGREQQEGEGDRTSQSVRSAGSMDDIQEAEMGRKWESIDVVREGSKSSMRALPDGSVTFAIEARRYRF